MASASVPFPARVRRRATASTATGATEPLARRVRRRTSPPTPNASPCSSASRAHTPTPTSTPERQPGAATSSTSACKPLDRVVPTLPNVRRVRPPLLRAAEDRRASRSPRWSRTATRDQPVRPALRSRRAASTRSGQGDFASGPMIDRVQAENPRRRCGSLLGRPAPGDHSLAELIDASPPPRPPSAARHRHRLRPTPRIFQLSGGTTGIPKLIPRTHNDYAYNSKRGAAGVRCHRRRCCCSCCRSRTTCRSPARASRASSCTAPRSCSATRQPQRRCLRADRAAPRHPYQGRAGAADPPDQRPGRSPTSTSRSVRVIQSGGQRMQPEVRLRTERAHPDAFVQENFGMAEGC